MVMFELRVSVTVKANNEASDVLIQMCVKSNKLSVMSYESLLRANSKYCVSG